MLKKRGNNEGSLRQRPNGSWEARYTVDGKQKSIYGATQAEALKKRREALSSIDRGQYVEPSKITVAQWLTQWEAIYGRPTWRDTTASTHHQSITVHLIPALGNIPLQKLGADDIQRFIIAQQAAGAKPASIIKQLSPLKGALRQAVLLKKRPDNPFVAVKQPKLTQDEIAYLTEDEQRAYIAELPDSTAGRLLRFILGTGLRIGEALALRWSDVENRQFTVRQTIATVSNMAEGEPRTRQSIHQAKTDAGMRTIPLGNDMRTLLDRQRAAQRTERLKAGQAWNDGGYVFASAVGTPMQARNARRVHEAALDASGVDHVTLHGLRHPYVKPKTKKYLEFMEPQAQTSRACGSCSLAKKSCTAYSISMRSSGKTYTLRISEDKACVKMPEAFASCTISRRFISALSCFSPCFVRAAIFAQTFLTRTSSTSVLAFFAR